eukprot:1227210-Pyramimonas_sp.AAC.1
MRKSTNESLNEKEGAARLTGLPFMWRLVLETPLEEVGSHGLALLLSLYSSVLVPEVEDGGSLLFAPPPPQVRFPSPPVRILTALLRNVSVPAKCGDLALCAPRPTVTYP